MMVVVTMMMMILSFGRRECASYEDESKKTQQGTLHVCSISSRGQSIFSRRFPTFVETQSQQ